MSVPRAELEGPSRTIVVEPLEAPQPREMPTEPEPERTPEPARQPEEVPA